MFDLPLKFLGKLTFQITETAKDVEVMGHKIKPGQEYTINNSSHGKSMVVTIEGEGYIEIDAGKQKQL